MGVKWNEYRDAVEELFEAQEETVNHLDKVRIFNDIITAAATNTSVRSSQRRELQPS